MSNQLFLIGPDLPRLAGLSVALRSVSRDITILDADRPLDHLLSERFENVQAIVVFLTGTENVADTRAAISRHTGVRFLLVSPENPPSAAMARIVRETGNEMIWRGERDVVIAATLISLLASSRQNAV